MFFDPAYFSTNQTAQQNYFESEPDGDTLVPEGETLVKSIEVAEESDVQSMSNGKCSLEYTSTPQLLLLRFKNCSSWHTWLGGHEFKAQMANAIKDFYSYHNQSFVPQISKNPIGITTEFYARHWGDGLLRVNMRDSYNFEL